jgi:hypothetical protein
MRPHVTPGRGAHNGGELSNRTGFPHCFGCENASGGGLAINTARGPVARHEARTSISVLRPTRFLAIASLVPFAGGLVPGEVRTVTDRRTPFTERRLGGGSPNARESGGGAIAYRIERGPYRGDTMSAGSVATARARAWCKVLCDGDSCVSRRRVNGMRSLVRGLP